MREYHPGRPFVFNHIPKTAGTMLSDALRTSLAPVHAVSVLDQALAGGYDGVDVSSRVRGGIVLSPEEIPADADFVCGHVSPGTTMARFPDADHLVVLRLPHVRFLSQVLHSRSVGELDIRHWGGTAAAFRAGWAPVRDYLQNPMVAPTVDNTMTRFLLWPHPAFADRTRFLEEAHDDELFEAALARLDRFAFVTVVEHEAFVDDLAAWLGRPLSLSHLNERRSVPARRRPDFDAELDAGTRDLLDHRTRIDTRIWAHVVGQVLPGADPVALRTATLERTLGHYRTVVAQPDSRPPARRLAEAVYEAGVRAHVLPKPGRASASR